MQYSSHIVVQAEDELHEELEESLIIELVAGGGKVRLPGFQL